jgi:Tfp pilus tip-associated adhesin PilY1
MLGETVCSVKTILSLQTNYIQINQNKSLKKKKKRKKERKLPTAPFRTRKAILGEMVCSVKQFSTN